MFTFIFCFCIHLFYIMQFFSVTIMFLFCFSFNGFIISLFQSPLFSVSAFHSMVLNHTIFSYHYVQFLLFFILWLYSPHFFSHHYVQFLFLLPLVFNLAFFSVTIIFSFCFCFHWFFTLPFSVTILFSFCFCFHWFLIMQFFQSPLCSVSVFAFIGF